MLNKNHNESKADPINEKVKLLEKSVSSLFNDPEIGKAAQQTMETLEFKDEAEIINDLRNKNDSKIVSNMKNILKKKSQIEWNNEQQNTFYTVLIQIFEQKITDPTVIINVHNCNKDTDANKGKRKGFLVLGGSYNPCHTEHVQLLHEIKCHLEQHENFIIIAAYLVVTTDGYVLSKLYENAMKYKHRHKICQLTASRYVWCHASHIQMISAKQYAHMITRRKSFETYFGSNPLINEAELDELITINCWGADRISPYHISHNAMNRTKSMIACIARKGYSEDIKEAYDAAKKKGECDGFFYIDSECKPISSTLIRKHLLKLRDKLCTKRKDGDGWKKKITANNKHKRAFREAVKDMLHSDAIEYLINNIDDLWLSESKVYGGGKPFVVKANSGNKKNCSNKKKKWWKIK